METEFMKEDMPETFSVAHVLEVASMFAAERDTSSRQALEYLRVRRELVEGTNGHILIRLPIDTQAWLTESRFVSAEEALITGKSRDDAQESVQGFSQDLKGFPDTDTFMGKMQDLPVTFECNVSPAYLEVIGKAFGMLGINKVRMRCRGEFDAIEFIGQRSGSGVGVAFLMPMK